MVVESKSDTRKVSSAPVGLWTKDFTVGTLLNFLLMVNYFSLMVVVTDYALLSLDASASVAGFVASVFIIGALFTRLLSGALIERIGRKRLLVIGVIAEVVFSAAYFASSGLAALFIIRLLHGCSYGICSTAIGTITTSSVPEERKGEGIGYYMLSVTLGAAIGPFLGILLMQQLGFSSIFVVSVVTAALCLICALVLAVPEAAPSHTAHAHRHLSFARFIEPAVVPISFVAALIYFGYSCLLTFLTPFAAEIGLDGAASVFFIVYAAAMFLTRPVTGKVYDRFGARFVMLPAFVGFMVGMLLLAQTQSALLMLVAAAFLGFGVGTVQACGLTIAVQKTPDARTGLANSTFYIFLDLGVGVGPMILGLFVAGIGYRGLFLVMVGLAAVALLLYLFISRRPAPAPEL
jgi:predicted MFS family arabinose efflux permease